MAITKIWKVSERLDITIDYAVNGDKTEQKLYVSGINCIPNTVFNEIKNVKKQFFKTTGIQGFHGVQSFAKEEVTPAQAHEIGIKLAEELCKIKEPFQIEIIGLCTDICVISNAFLIKSLLPEVKISVKADCCAGVTPDSHKNALSAMSVCQIEIIGE